MGKAEQLLELLDLQSGSFKGASRAELFAPGLVLIQQVPQLSHLVLPDGSRIVNFSWSNRQTRMPLSVLRARKQRPVVGRLGSCRLRLRGQGEG